MSRFTERRARREHDLQRNFVRIAHRQAAPRPKRSSIQLEFHGVSFRSIGKHRRSVYHQLDGSIELADSCTCILHFSEGNISFPDFQPMRVERSRDCLIDEHRIAAQQGLMEDAAQ